MWTSSVLMVAFLLPATGDFASGPQVGDKLPDFKSHAFSGDDAGKEFKILGKTKGGPTLLIFMHATAEKFSITRPGNQFLRPVDAYAATQKKLAANIVWVTGDKEKVEGWLKLTDALKLQTPVSICLEGGKDGPATYGLNDKVQITVLVCKDNKVINNFALTDPNANDSRKVIVAVAKVLGKAPPKEEKQPAKKRPIKKGKERSPELQKLMRSIIQKDNSADDVKGIAEKMAKWAGDDAKKLAELRDFAALVVRLGYGNEHAQAALKKLAK
ncbi:MAG: hypothetical protein HYX68_22995 [Planctomycetes bacterium]|nr:hypothetical protein [Planctomycetota bacterium]